MTQRLRTNERQDVLTLKANTTYENENHQATLNSPIDSTNANETIRQKCRHYDVHEAIQWVSNDVKGYTSFESWEKHIIDDFSRKYCQEWITGKDKEAYRLFNIASTYANEHFKSIQSEEEVVTYLKAENEHLLAPWEIPFAPKRKITSTA